MRYTEPEMEIINLAVVDVLTTSEVDDTKCQGENITDWG